jgi:hypothetical protein
MALPPLPPEGTPFLDQGTGRMNQWWRAFFKAFAPLLEDVANSIAAIAGEVAALQLEDNWTDFIVEVENGDIVVQQDANFAGTINRVVTQSASGTCTVTVKINGVSIGATNSVSSTEDIEAHDDDFAVGDVISYTISSNSSCLGARIQIDYTRALSGG